MNLTLRKTILTFLMLVAAAYWTVALLTSGIFAPSQLATSSKTLLFAAAAGVTVTTTLFFRRSARPDR